jgi:cytidylate kinase
VIIAIDGPAAAGKGTLGRRLAEYFGFAYLDTGKLYRSIGFKILQAGGNLDDPLQALDAANSLKPEDLNYPAITGDEAAAAASKIAGFESTRAALRHFQRDFAANPPGGAIGAILDGRDIGTVICPDADIKIFITADLETRAKRRHKELLERGEPSIYARVLRGMSDRDTRDLARTVAPLIPADDAYLLDTASLDADAAFALVIEYIDAQFVSKASDKTV